MREVSTGSGASSSTTRSSRAAQSAYVASHQGSARPFWRRGWPNTRSQLSANTGPSSSTTTAAPATRRPTNRRNALRRTICFSSSRGSARVTTQSRSSRGSERTALSISSAQGRFQTLARTTSRRASRRCARALFPTPAGPTSSTISGRAAPLRPVMIPLQLAPQDGLQLGEHGGQRPAGVHDMHPPAAPIGIPHQLAAGAHIVGGLVGLALHGGFGIDAQQDENVGSENVAVVARLGRYEPAAEPRPRERRKRVEPRPRQRRILGHRIALAQRDPAPQCKAPRLQVQLVPVAGRAEVPQGGEVGRPARAILVRLYGDAQQPPDPDQGAADEREQQAGRAAQMRSQEAELVREPVSELARAGGLSRAVAAEQRDDRAAVREMLAALADDLEPAAQGEDAVHDAAERQRQRRPSRMRQEATVHLPPHQQPSPAGTRRTQRSQTVVDELSVEGRKVRRQDLRYRRAVRLGEQGVELDLDPFEPTWLPPEHRVEGVVALDHPSGEHDELEFGCGDGENYARPGRGQKG